MPYCTLIIHLLFSANFHTSGLFIGFPDHFVWVIVLPEKGGDLWLLFEPCENCYSAACMAVDKTMTSLEIGAVNCAYMACITCGKIGVITIEIGKHISVSF